MSMSAERFAYLCVIDFVAREKRTRRNGKEEIKEFLSRTYFFIILCYGFIINYGFIAALLFTATYGAKVLYNVHFVRICTNHPIN